MIDCDCRQFQGLGKNGVDSVHSVFLAWEGSGTRVRPFVAILELCYNLSQSNGVIRAYFGTVDSEDPSMTVKNVTLQLPETLYLRLQQAANGMHQTLDEVLLRALQVGSPPSWEDAPAVFQSDLAALDRLDDQSLWRIARSTQLDEDWSHYQELLEKNADSLITASERLELERLSLEADRFMLRKAQAAALLRWRGHTVPLASTSRASV